MEPTSFQPNIHLVPLAIGLAVLAHFIIGFLWYTPLFGKVWAKEMKLSIDQRPPASLFIKYILINIFGNFLLVWVLAHNIAAWTPNTWGINQEFVPPAGAALSSAIFTWLGFFVPQALSDSTWGGRSWKLFFINTGYQLIALITVSFILVFVK